MLSKVLKVMAPGVLLTVKLSRQGISLELTRASHLSPGQVTKLWKTWATKESCLMLRPADLYFLVNVTLAPDVSMILGFAPTIVLKVPQMGLLDRHVIKGLILLMVTVRLHLLAPIAHIGRATCRQTTSSIP